MYETRRDRGRRPPDENHRLGALVEASLLLARVIADSTGLSEVAPKLLGELGHAIGWDCAVLFRVEPMGKRLVAVGTWQANPGQPSRLIESSRHLELAHGEGLAGHAWKLGQPVWLPCDQAEGLFRRAREASEDGISAGLAFPIRAGADVVGVMELFAFEAKEHDADLLGALGDLAEPIGNIIAHAQREDAHRLLDDASTALFGSLDYKESLERVASLSVPRLADLCVVHCIGDDGLADQVASAHIDSATMALMREQGPRFRLQVQGTLARLIGEKEPFLKEPFLKEQLSPEPFLEVEDAEHRGYLRALGFTSVMVLPLRARGRALGFLTLGTVGSRRYTRSDVAVAEELARRASLAIDNARLFESERTARAQAEAATRAKDEFLAVLSHELRTPLQSMLGWTQMLRSRRLDETTAARGLAAIERATRAQAQLIGDLLDVSRIVAGKLSVELHRVDLVPIVDNALEALRAQAEAKKIKLERSLACTQAHVVGDSHRLQQVLTNLVSNAIKFTGSGGRITLRLDCSETSARVVVEDTGAGILPEFLPHVFERFRQADSTSRRAHGGLGLGLTIVRHLVELHGGTVTAASEGEDKGARFEMVLPLSCPTADPRKDSSADALDSRHLPKLDGMRMLVVDDDEETRELIRAVLENCGAEVICVSSASRALEIVSEHPPDLLISDVRMPQEDGYTFIRRVRALGEARGGAIPAIALTADASFAAQDDALAAGFQKHLAKPVQPLDLARVIASLRHENTGIR